MTSVYIKETQKKIPTSKVCQHIKTKTDLFMQNKLWIENKVVFSLYFYKDRINLPHEPYVT